MMGNFQLAQGVSVSNLEGIHECYEVIERPHPSDGQPFYSFAINISIEKLSPLLIDFCKGLEEPGFFLCEIPTSQQEELELRQSEQDPFHKNVYYRDGCSRHELLRLLEAYGEWFIQDGMSCFGFASHNSKDEIFVGKYKITNIFTRNAERYKALLAQFGIPQEAQIKTVWKNFCHEAPGECSLFALKGRTVYDIVEEMQKNGLYLAEQREE